MEPPRSADLYARSDGRIDNVWRLMARPDFDDPKPDSAIVAIVNTERAETLLFEALRPRSGYPSEWCFPGGSLAGHERTEDAARCEVCEETGYQVGNLTCVGGQPSTSKTGRTFLIACFVCVDWGGTLIGFPSAEHAAAAWVPLNELLRREPLGTATRFLAGEVVSHSGRSPHRRPSDAQKEQGAGAIGLTVTAEHPPVRPSEVAPTRWRGLRGLALLVGICHCWVATASNLTMPWRSITNRAGR